MATIYDIAEKLGVSPSTVSRALSGRGYCKEETRKRIIQAAEELDYAPDQSAKMLKTRVSNKVLFTVPDMCNPFYFDMIQGINDVLDPYGYLLILMDTKNRLEEEKRAIQLLREKYADGMIMVSFDFCEENIGLLNRLHAPVVLTNQYVSPAGKTVSIMSGSTRSWGSKTWCATSRARASAASGMLAAVCKSKPAGNATKVTARDSRRRVYRCAPIGFEKATIRNKAVIWPDCPC
ncbi:hypothetical protein HMSSN139_10390 [Paenibacillus sp. HMSSN-139]|nr:hypothetical protein HMSSN139_10390 [Paenibacillus sp. HMSSN-139]